MFPFMGQQWAMTTEEQKILYSRQQCCLLHYARDQVEAPNL